MSTPSDSVEIYCLKCCVKNGSRDVEQVTLKSRNPSEEPLSRNISIYGAERNAAASAGNGVSSPKTPEPNSALYILTLQP